MCAEVTDGAERFARERYIFDHARVRSTRQPHSNGDRRRCLDDAGEETRAGAPLPSREPRLLCASTRRTGGRVVSSLHGAAHWSFDDRLTRRESLTSPRLSDHSPREIEVIRTWRRHHARARGRRHPFVATRRRVAAPAQPSSLRRRVVVRFDPSRWSQTEVARESPAPTMRSSRRRRRGPSRRWSIFTT